MMRLLRILSVTFMLVLAYLFIFIFMDYIWDWNITGFDGGIDRVMFFLWFLFSFGIGCRAEVDNEN